MLPFTESACPIPSWSTGTAVDQRHQLQLDAEGIATQVLNEFFPDRVVTPAAAH